MLFDVVWKYFVDPELVDRFQGSSQFTSSRTHLQDIACMASETAVMVLSASDASLHRKLAHLPSALYSDVLLATFPELRERGEFVLDCRKHSTSSITGALAAAHRVPILRELHLVHYGSSVCCIAPPEGTHDDLIASKLKEYACENAPLQALCDLVRNT